MWIRKQFINIIIYSDRLSLLTGKETVKCDTLADSCTLGFGQFDQSLFTISLLILVISELCVLINAKPSFPYDKCVIYPRLRPRQKSLFIRPSQTKVISNKTTQTEVTSDQTVMFSKVTPDQTSLRSKVHLSRLFSPRIHL